MNWIKSVGMCECFDLWLTPWPAYSNVGTTCTIKLYFNMNKRPMIIYNYLQLLQLSLPERQPTSVPSGHRHIGASSDRWPHRGNSRRYTGHLWTMPWPDFQNNPHGPNARGLWVRLWLEWKTNRKEYPKRFCTGQLWGPFPHKVYPNRSVLVAWCLQEVMAVSQRVLCLWI